MESGWRHRIVAHGEANPRDLIPNPANWRLHPGAQRDALSGVLAQVGWVQNVVVNRRTGHILDGHLRVALATLDPLGAMAAVDGPVPQTLLGAVEAEDAAVAALLGRLAQEAVAAELPGDSAAVAAAHLDPRRPLAMRPTSAALWRCDRLRRSGAAARRGEGGLAPDGSALRRGVRRQDRGGAPRPGRPRRRSACAAAARIRGRGPRPRTRRPDLRGAPGRAAQPHLRRSVSGSGLALARHAHLGEGPVRLRTRGLPLPSRTDPLRLETGPTARMVWGARRGLRVRAPSPGGEPKSSHREARRADCGASRSHDAAREPGLRSLRRFRLHPDGVGAAGPALCCDGGGSALRRRGRAALGGHDGTRRHACWGGSLVRGDRGGAACVAGRRTKLSADVHQQVVAFIRAGAYDWVAAEAAGIGRSTFYRWLQRGERDGRSPYRPFAHDVRQARAQARVAAETEVRRDQPLAWLRYGPGRERPGRRVGRLLPNCNTPDPMTSRWSSRWSLERRMRTWSGRNLSHPERNLRRAVSRGCTGPKFHPWSVDPHATRWGWRFETPQILRRHRPEARSRFRAVRGATSSAPSGIYVPLPRRSGT